MCIRDSTWLDAEIVPAKGDESQYSIRVVMDAIRHVHGPRTLRAQKRPESIAQHIEGDSGQKA
eukprot:4636191-Prorocentrum_lima.AAC.1